jgi:hypothetical protein
MRPVKPDLLDGLNHGDRNEVAIRYGHHDLYSSPSDLPNQANPPVAIFVQSWSVICLSVPYHLQHLTHRYVTNQKPVLEVRVIHPHVG